MNLNHRYWVFVIYTYYPAGGLDDVAFTSNSLGEALAYLAKNPAGDYRSILDVQRRKFVDL